MLHLKLLICISKTWNRQHCFEARLTSRVPSCRNFYGPNDSCCPSNLFLKLHNWYCHTCHKLQVLQELALLLFHLITLQYICFSSWSKWLSCALKSVTFTFMLVTYFHYIHNMHAEKNTYGIVSQFLVSITRLGEQFKLQCFNDFNFFKCLSFVDPYAKELQSNQKIM